MGTKKILSARLLFLSIVMMTFTSLAQARSFDKIERNEVLSPYEESERALEARYLELVNTYDPHYMEDDPICRSFRQEEMEVRRKKQREVWARTERIESMILNICRQTGWDAFSNIVGRVVDAGKNVLWDVDFSGLGERVRHKALSQDAYDILTYEKLDEFLDTKCYPGQPWVKILFKTAVVSDDTLPSAIGTAGGVIAGWFILRGAGRMIWKPAKSTMESRGVTAATFKKIKVAGWLLAVPAISLPLSYSLMIQKDQYEEEFVRSELQEERSRLSLEATFPEPGVDLAARECEESLKNSLSAPTNELKNFWLQLAQPKCEIYAQRVATARQLLTADEYNRCHPGNKGALGRINEKFERFLSEHPEFDDFVH